MNNLKKFYVEYSKYININILLNYYNIIYCYIFI